MKHYHFKEIHSTQAYLKNLSPSREDEILVTTDYQSQGKGQKDREWIHFENSLAMSFTITPNEVLTLTALEIGVLVTNFFKEKFQKTIKLKWPNDLLTKDGEKLGGIIINISQGGPAIIGMGFNLVKENLSYNPSKEYTSNGLLTSDEFNTNLEELTAKIYSYILGHRLTSNEIRNEWNKQCIHLDKEVRFIEGDESHYFIFKGIGDSGEAILLDKSNKLHHKFSGSIRI